MWAVCVAAVVVGTHVCVALVVVGTWCVAAVGMGAWVVLGGLCACSGLHGAHLPAIQLLPSAQEESGTLCMRHSKHKLKGRCRAIPCICET